MLLERLSHLPCESRGCAYINRAVYGTNIDWGIGRIVTRCTGKSDCLYDAVTGTIIHILDCSSVSIDDLFDLTRFVVNILNRFRACRGGYEVQRSNDKK